MKNSHALKKANSQFVLVLVLLLVGWLLAGCAGEPPATPQPTTTPIAAAPATATTDGYPAPTAVPDTGYPGESAPLPALPDSYPGAESTTEPARFGYTIINRYPHNPDSFTQGLVWHNGRFLEGTGLRGQSALMSVDLATGEAQQRVPLDERYFGEGVTELNGRIYQITWQAQTAFVYDTDSFELLETFSYPTDGWGLTDDGERLIMSDGSATLYFRDPDTFAEIGRVAVTNRNQPQSRLNELEYIDGLVYANVFGANTIVQIEPDTGMVVGVIDLTGLREAAELTESVLSDAYLNSNAVLNGIAYDEENGRLFVTGKLWPTLFEIELTPLD